MIVKTCPLVFIKSLDLVVNAMRTTTLKTCHLVRETRVTTFLKIGWYTIVGVYLVVVDITHLIVDTHLSC